MHQSLQWDALLDSIKTLIQTVFIDKLQYGIDFSFEISEELGAIAKFGKALVVFLEPEALLPRRADKYAFECFNSFLI